MSEFIPRTKICPGCGRDFIQKTPNKWRCPKCMDEKNKTYYSHKKDRRESIITLESPIVIDYDPDNLYSKGAEFDPVTIPGNRTTYDYSIAKDSFSPGTIVLCGEEKKKCIYDGKQWQVMA